MNKCVFLDRDGVINVDFVDYVYTIEKFAFLPKVKEALVLLKKEGYKLIVITNQSGIIKGIYSPEDVVNVYGYIQKETDGALDDMYVAPYHETYTASLTRKPDSLMLEKAIAKYDTDIEHSWMIGDKERDLIPGKKLGLNTAIIGQPTPYADKIVKSLYEAVEEILKRD